MSISRLVAPMGIAALLLIGCSRTSAQQRPMPGPADVVATVGSTAITLAQVDEKALQQAASTFGAMKLSQALYEARRAAVEEIVASKLIDAAAKAQGIDRAALIEKEITAKISPVSESEIASWYQANQGRLQGAPLEQVKQPIRAFLTQERMQEVRGRYVDSLKAKTAVAIMLEPPRQKVEMVSSSPSRGPANAPVEVVDFSDFQ